MTNHTRSEAASNGPVQSVETGSVHTTTEPGIALCLSGGGYRAMLFHVGSLWRLYEAGLLGKAKRISSVSGGSVTSAILGLRWSRLGFGSSSDDFVREVAEPIRRLADRTLDAGSIIEGIFLPGSISDKIALVRSDQNRVTRCNHRIT